MADDGFEARLSEVCARKGWGESPGNVEIKFDNGRRQTVRVERFAFEGDELVRFFTTIGPATRIEPMRLSQGLRISFGLPHGALALKNDDLVMVDTASSSAPAEEIEAVLRYLAETADHFERTMFGGDEH